MCHFSGVSFSHIIYVFLMKMVWKRLEVMVYYCILFLFARPFIAVDCWKPEISCCTEESFWVMEKMALPSCQLIHIKRKSAEYKINSWKVILE